MAYNDAFSVADRYMKECVRYLNDNKKTFRCIGEVEGLMLIV